MTSTPWFRFYSEALNDHKMQRIVRETQLPLPDLMKERLAAWPGDLRGSKKQREPEPEQDTPSLQPMML